MFAPSSRTHRPLEHIMSTLARAGLVGSIVYCLHKQRATFAEMKSDIGAPGSGGQDYELKLVQVIFRHGARTPLKPIPHNEQV